MLHIWNNYVAGTYFSGTEYDLSVWLWPSSDNYFASSWRFYCVWRCENWLPEIVLGIGNEPEPGPGTSIPPCGVFLFVGVNFGLRIHTPHHDFNLFQEGTLKPLLPWNKPWLWAVVPYTRHYLQSPQDSLSMTNKTRQLLSAWNQMIEIIHRRNFWKSGQCLILGYRMFSERSYITALPHQHWLHHPMLQTGLALVESSSYCCFSFADEAKERIEP